MLFRALVISGQAQCALWLQRLVFPLLLVVFFINVATFMRNTCVGREKASRQIFWRIRDNEFRLLRRCKKWGNRLSTTCSSSNKPQLYLFALRRSERCTYHKVQATMALRNSFSHGVSFRSSDFPFSFLLSLFLSFLLVSSWNNLQLRASRASIA